VGRRTQVWEVRIADELGKAVCVSRCTIAVIPAAAA
jgi:acyl-coenzyme A thioesterase PaaI-like protein